MEVKGFGKKDSQRHSGVSSIIGSSSSSAYDHIVSFTLISGNTVGTSTDADSLTVMELIPVGVGGKCEPVGSVEEQSQQIILILKEHATKDMAITLDKHKMPAIAKVVNEVCVLSNSLHSNTYVTRSKENLCVLRSLDSRGTVTSNVLMDPQHATLQMDHQNPSSSEPLSIQHSNNYPNRIGAVIW